MMNGVFIKAGEPIILNPAVELMPNRKLELELSTAE